MRLAGETCLICMAGVYLTIVMAMTSISVIMTVFVLNLHYRGPDDRPVPRWLRRLLGYQTLHRGLTIRRRFGQCAVHKDNIFRDHEEHRGRNHCPPGVATRQRSQSAGDCVSGKRSTTEQQQRTSGQHDSVTSQFNVDDDRQTSLHVTVETLADELSAELQQVRATWLQL